MLALVLCASVGACGDSGDGDSGASTHGGTESDGTQGSGTQASATTSDTSGTTEATDGGTTATGGGSTASGGATTSASDTTTTTSDGTGEDTNGASTGSDTDGDTDGGEPTVGAKVPFVSYEAEDGELGGGATVIALATPPTTRFSSPELEASGHAFVRLDATGEYVEWTNETGHDVTALNLRVSIPDAPSGYGIDSTIDVYVDGEYRQSLPVTSTQTWGYEGNDHYNGQTQNPADGNPRTFWDETHAFLIGAPLGTGGILRIHKGADNDAAFYDIDVVDVEAPPPPIEQPAASLSIAEFGAVADDPNVDNTSALQDAIDAAEQQQKVLYLPPGRFYFRSTGGLQAESITIQGAGMWYTTIHRNVPLPNDIPLGAVFNLTSCKVMDFAIDSNATGRDRVDGGGGGMDTTGVDWLADRIWTQHTLSGFWASGTGGTVQNCRLTAIWADGCNVNNVSLGNSIGENLVVQNNFVRGTGDDAIAINSVDYNGDPPNQTFYTPMSNVTVQNNTSIAPWGGKGVSIYGGSGHVVKNNYMSDTARYIGLGVGKFGANGSNLESAMVTDNVIVRCGGNAYEQQQPAVHVGNGGDGHGTGTVANATVARNTVIDALYDGVGFSTSSEILFDENTIERPGLDGIVVSPNFYPAPTGSATISNNMVLGLEPGRAPYVNNSDGYMVTLSGNNF